MRMTLTRPRELAEKVVETRRRYRRGEVSLDVLYAAADAYIQACVAHQRQRRVKFRPPSRATVLRAL